ncbi:MAG: AAA family ATPase [Candidatus Jordarchaeum sp.]|uniref:AAA family ATPase n=1 Tax=Candidatus Jordarchaeum sp. TaxID=2823881 RepID=UPI0040498ED8
MITEVKLNNFMSYDNASVPLSPSFNVIVGRNGAGKTSIITAIKIAFGSLGRERHRLLDRYIRHGEKAARISIVIENKNGVGERIFTDLSDDKVEITRIFRKGKQSLFRLNGKPIQLRSLKTLLFNAGINPDNPLVTIPQGQVNDLIKAKPIERAYFMVEALGLGFALKRIEESKEKLRENKENLKGLSTRLGEARKELRTRKNRKEKYLEKIELEGTKNKLEAMYPFSLKYQKESELSQAIEKFEKLNIEIRELELSLENREKEYNSTVKKISELNLKEDNLLHMREEIYREKSQLSEEKSRLQYDINALKEEGKIPTQKTYFSNISKIKRVIESINIKGEIIGPIAEYLKIKDSRYNLAIESALGRRVIESFVTTNRQDCILLHDKVISKGIRTRIYCVTDKYQKPSVKKPVFPGAGIIDWAVNMVTVPEVLRPIVEEILSRYLIVDNLENGLVNAKTYNTPVVTLNGTRITYSPAGYFNIDIPLQFSIIESFNVKDNESKVDQIPYALEKSTQQLKELTEKVQELEQREKDTISNRLHIKNEIDSLTNERDSLNREVTELKVRLKTLNENLPFYRSLSNSLREELKELEPKIELIDSALHPLKEEILPLPKLDQKINRIEAKLEALREYSEEDLISYEEYEKIVKDIEEQRKKLEIEQEILVDTLKKEQSKLFEELQTLMVEFNENFEEILREVGGKGFVELKQESDQLALYLFSNFREKEPFSVDTGEHSGGEKNITTMAFLLALQRVRPSPFYLFDEFGIHTDPANKEAISKMIRACSDRSQYVVITPMRLGIAEQADHVIGVFRDTEGKSRIEVLQKKDFEEVEAT